MVEQQERCDYEQEAVLGPIPPRRVGRFGAGPHTCSFWSSFLKG